MIPHPAALPTRRQIAAALFHPAVVVGALGYFVDIYDLILFGIVRQPSLQSLGYKGDELVTFGTWLFNWQMGGMLVGGLLWGLLGDWRGRLNLLFGSIVLYSLANITNGMVHGITGYTICRFIAGVGLAGELGGSITLVSEILPRALRGYGTMMVSAVGVLGAVVGGVMGHWMDWRIMFFVGGGMGLLLLVLRLWVSESPMYDVMRGRARPTFASQLVLLVAPSRFGRYLCCILIGLPCWYVIGLVILYSPEFARALGSTATIVAGTSIAWAYGGICLGDLLSGMLSQFSRARKAILLVFLIATLTMINVFFFQHAPSPGAVYTLCFFTGITVGYWAVFVTVAAEHFGTNMRATVTTTVPNFSRGAVIPVTMLYAHYKPEFGSIHTALTLGWLVMILAFVGWAGLRETFHDDLDYVES